MAPKLNSEVLSPAPYSNEAQQNQAPHCLAETTIVAVAADPANRYVILCNEPPLNILELRSSVAQ